jgi:hypothetical protein
VVVILSSEIHEEHVASLLLHRNKPRKKTLKMEAKYFSETSVDFQRTTLRYMPEDRTIYLWFN